MFANDRLKLIYSLRKEGKQLGYFDKKEEAVKWAMKTGGMIHPVTVSERTYKFLLGK